MIPLFKPFVSDRAIENVNEVLRSGYIAQGPRVDEFEEAISNYLSKYIKLNIVTVNSCTGALELALYLIKTQHKLQPDTEVLSTPVTCFATNAPIVHNGFKIKWCDIDKETLNIDLGDVVSKLTSKTRILMIVHWGGNPVNPATVFQIKELYKAHFHQELFVIEDCAHAFGANEHLCKVGVTDPTNYSCFSLQAIKNLTTGDGGILITPDDTYARARKLRWFGLDRDNKATFRHMQDIEEAGFKYHMNDIAAAIGLGNLPFVDYNIHLTQMNALAYCNLIKNRDAVFVPAYNELSSYWLFTIFVDNNKDFQLYMKEHGIEVNPVHTRNDKLSCFSRFQRNDLHNVDDTEHTRICIPVGWHINMQNVQYIADVINKWRQ